MNDTESFRIMVEQHGKKVFGLAFRMMGNEADAEDVVQETFLRAYRNRHKYDGRSQVTTWLYTIASNYSIDLLRKRKRRQAEALDTTEQVRPVKSNDPGPETSTRGSELRERVERELLKLTPKERAAFTLRHFEELSIREISTITGTAEGSVKNNIFRAVRKLRAALEPALGARS